MTLLPVIESENSGLLYEDCLNCEQKWTLKCIFLLEISNKSTSDHNFYGSSRGTINITGYLNSWFLVLVEINLLCCCWLSLGTMYVYVLSSYENICIFFNVVSISSKKIGIFKQRVRRKEVTMYHRNFDTNAYLLSFVL